LLKEGAAVDVITRYCQTVEALQHTQEPWTEEQLLICLSTRDAISRGLKAGELDDVGLIHQLFVADRALRALTRRLAEVEVIPCWRDSLQPSADAWWWFPPATPSTHWWNRLDWLFNSLTLVLLAITLSFVVDIATRFYHSGFDLVGALTIVLPTLLASLSAGGLFSSTLQEGMNRIMQRLSIHASYQHEARLGIAVVVWLLVLGVWIKLPLIARAYNDHGEANRAQGQLDKARTDLERAIKLDPENMVAHYNLGNIYEDLFSNEKAIPEYQIAAAAGLDLAHNNLGRLYILQGDYNKAVQVLRQALRLLSSDEKVQEVTTRYNVLKNLGWAHVGQQRLNEAHKLLHEAMALLPDKAPAYCLLGKTYAGLGKRPEAEAAWHSCIRWAHADDPDEDRWIGEGQAYIGQLGPGGVQP
jgi:tetratricopeptide (TPR) repeat protein